jgi:hypothetical protein
MMYLLHDGACVLVDLGHAIAASSRRVPTGGRIMAGESLLVYISEDL